MILRIPIRAKPTPRPQAKKGQKAYYPAAYQDYRTELEWLIKQAWLETGGGPWLLDSQSVTIEFGPKDILIELLPAESTRKGVRGDIDNLYKGVADALESVGVIENDRQIHEMHCRFS